MDVTLPSGNTATLKDAADLKTGDKLKIQQAISIDMVGGDMKLTMAVGEELKVAMLAQLISMWSFGDAPSVESVLNLSLADYDALCAATAAHAKLLGVGATKS